MQIGLQVLVDKAAEDADNAIAANRKRRDPVVSVDSLLVHALVKSKEVDVHFANR